MHLIITLPISIGMQETDVIQIQTGLTNLRYNLGNIDGIFGTKTYNPAISFQKSKFIKGTGVVDSVTLKALNNVLITKITEVK